MRVVVHDRGPLCLGIRATISMPGVEPRVCVDGEMLVDGGVMNNLPVDVMRERFPGTVIASDESLRADISGLRKLSGVSDLYVHTPIEGRPLFDQKAAALQAIDRWHAEVGDALG